MQKNAMVFEKKEITTGDILTIKSMKGIQNTSTENFSSIIGNNRKFYVPKFQRDYSWDKEQWDDLWMDIDSMLKGNTDHYMGYLVLQTTDNKTFHIIDGQQRFTTITLLILAAIKVIKTLIDADIEPEHNKTRMESLLRTYIGNVDPVSLEYDNILILNRNNDPYYKDFIVKLSELRVRNTTVTEKLMKHAFEFMYSKVKDKYSTGKELAEFVQKVTDNLFFTTIIVNDDMNAFRVFETLNARGVQLSSSDLLKNYLFSMVDTRMSHIENINILEQKWSRLTNNIKSEKLPDFIRYYWNATHKLIRANELFKTIRTEIRDERQVFVFINDLLDYSDVFMALLDGSDELWEEDDVIRKYIDVLKIFSLKQHFSVLMSAWKNLSKDDFKKVLRAIIVVTFRYSIIGDKNPNEIERVFNEVSQKLQTEKQFKNEMFKKVYVEDQDFYQDFKTKSFASSRSSKVVRYILSELERSYGNNVELQYLSDKNTIEHILPQNPSEDWGIDAEKVDRLYGRIGNLCLLERRKNDDLGNMVYNKKAEVYKSSSFVMTQRLPEEYEQWNDSSIHARQNDMAMRAKSIWSLSF